MTPEDIRPKELPLPEAGHNVRQDGQKGIDMKRLGVIGGLGPMATVYFLQLVTQMSLADTDQEHMEIFLHSNPQIPDRTRFILGQSQENPLPMMIEAGRGLARWGAELIAVPCVTAHYFHGKLEEGIGLPMINTPVETAKCLKEEGIGRAGIMATDGTVASGLLQKALEAWGIHCVLPDREGQKKVMSLIYEDVKAGRPADLGKLQEVSGQLFGAGAEAVLLACTELSLVKRDFPLGPGFLDVLEVLARSAVVSCGRLKGEYKSLITRQQ